MARSYDPVKAVKRQIQGVQANVEKYQDGVRSNTKHPGEEAIKRKPKMRQRFLEALDSGKFDEGARSYSLQQWQDRTATVGARNLPQGVADAADKTQQFHEQFSEFLDGHMSKIDAMPDNTIEERLAKMRENALGIAKFKRHRRK